jgi:hypothetical protein
MTLSCQVLESGKYYTDSYRRDSNEKTLHNIRASKTVGGYGSALTST